MPETPKFQRCDIVWASPIGPDGKPTGRHPALIIADPLCNNHGDYVLIQITTRSWHGKTDFILTNKHPEFTATGLAHGSTLRCHKIFPLAFTAVREQIGVAGPEIMKEVETRLRAMLHL